MKRTYVRPTMVGERFVANEYVAACGDTEYGKYKFICDAGGGKKGDVYEPGLLRYYHSCNVTHYADTNDEFLEGYYVPFGGSAQKVIIWTDHGRNVHCTTNLNRESWETTKS